MTPPADRRSRLARLAALAGTIAFGAGCEHDDSLLLGDVPPPPIVWEGENLRVGTELDLEQWCEGNLGRLDRRVAALRDLFEVPAEEGIVTYYLLEPALFEDGVCDGTLACTYLERRTVVTSKLPDDHEIVHAVGAAHGNLPNFFEEGAATYFGGLGGFGSSGLHSGPSAVRELLDDQWDGGIGGEGYRLAADFTAYLVHTHGLEAYVALLKSGDRDQSRAQFEPVFEGAIGLTLDQALDDYEASWNYCGPQALRSPFFECSQPAIAVSSLAESNAFDLDISCTDANVLGPLPDTEGTPRIWQELVVEVAVDSGRLFVMLFDEPAAGTPNTVLVDVQPCDAPCLPGPGNYGGFSHAPPETEEESNPAYLTLDPGRWAVRVSRAADDPGRVRFRWE